MACIPEEKPIWRRVHVARAFSCVWACVLAANVEMQAAADAGPSGGVPTFSVEIVEVNGVDWPSAPDDKVMAWPGDILTVEVFLRDWSPQGQELHGYQFELDSSGYTSGAIGNVYPVDWETTTDINDCSSGGPDGLPNDANAFIDVDLDWVFGENAIEDVTVSVDSSRCDYLYSASLDAGASGPVSQAEKLYLGTVILELSKDATAIFNVCLDLADEQEPIGSPDNTFLIDQNQELIFPLESECLTIQSANLCHCLEDTDCEDGDDCTTDTCEPCSCVFDPRTYGDANKDGDLNILDVVCAARVTFQDATTCGDSEISLDEIDIAPSAPCGDGALNITDVVAHALAAFQDAIDECCGG